MGEVKPRRWRVSDGLARLEHDVVNVPTGVKEQVCAVTPLCGAIGEGLIRAAIEFTNWMPATLSQKFAGVGAITEILDDGFEDPGPLTVLFYFHQYSWPLRFQ
jgi:hypothetical protein